MASRWLGVRAFVAGTGSLDHLPPAAVEVWDRYLAYGAAMDLSEVAVEGLLMHFRTDMKVSDVVQAGHSLMDPNLFGGVIAQQMAQVHADKLQELGPGFTESTPFGPDAGDFCVLAASMQRGLSAGVPAWGATFPQWAQALVRRADVLRDAAPPEIASSVWALYHDLSPLLAELSHATTMQAIAPAMKGYETVLSSPTTKQHAEEVACVPRRRVPHADRHAAVQRSMSATGTPSPAESRTVAMRRPVCTAARASLTRSGPRTASVASRSSDRNVSPQKLSRLVASASGGHDFEDDLGHAEERLLHLTPVSRRALAERGAARALARRARRSCDRDRG